MPAVVITQDAKRDLQDIFAFIATHDSVAHAEIFLTELERAVLSLDRHTGRGAVVPELAELGMQHYRQLVVKPYRLIYQLRDAQVFVVVVAHSKRDMQSVLQQRLLR